MSSAAAILDIPEVVALDTRRALVRIPPEVDVPLTPRVRQLIDTPDFRRLARISQLGLVALVYPAAIHTRFEHSLGVYRLALLYMKQLAHDERFAGTVRPADVEVFIVAALLHDLGHWPFCHPIEDIRLPSVPSHELFANSFLLEGEIADVLRHDWDVNPRDVVALLSEKPRDVRGAMDYALNNWAALCVYTEDGWLDIDNNEGENSLRGLCLGRKNWLFLGSDRGGRAAAVHFSLLASCKRHGHDPWAYYRDILIRLPAMLPTATEEELLALLPHRWKPA
jgi:hypothetical protein